jgi:DNA-binding NarL/FixJ family response regulator
MTAPDDKIYTVAVADDHTLMRTGVASFIARTGKYRVCLEAANGKELLEQLDRSGLPDIILLDISMPVMDGFKVMDLLKRKYENIRVIVLTMHDRYSDMLKMIMLGIKGYVLKTQLEADILCALDAVASNGEYFPEEINEDLQPGDENILYQKKIVEQV